MNIQFIRMINLFEILKIPTKNLPEFKYLESEVVCSQTNQQVEKWSEIIFFVIVKMAPLGGTLSRVVGSFFFYLRTDLGRDAFELPVPMW